MTRHTKEPWVVGPVDDTVVTHVGADGARYEVASVDGDYNQPDEWPTMEANARRIVDSVNALAGIPDPLAFVQAARGMAEALQVVGMSAAWHSLSNESKELVHAALTTFCAATGDVA